GGESVVVVPTTTVSLLTERAMSAALSLGQTVVALGVAGDERERDRTKHEWATWRCDVPIEVIVDHRRSLVRTVVRYVEAVDRKDVTLTVLIPELVPAKRRHEILHNQRGELLEA